MQAARNIFKVTPVVKSAIQPQRSMSIIATPARNKISTAEMIILSTAMVVGWTAVPAWVLCNIKNYRHDD